VAEPANPGPGMADKSTRVEAERDYYRGVAECLGRKALTDAQDFTRLIDDLRATEAELRRGREDLERQVAARTADLTRSNSELAEITSRYDELVRRIPNGVYTLRMRADGRPTFEYLSPRACLMLGYDHDAVLADADLGFAGIHPDDLDDLYRANDAATLAGDPLSWEGRFVVDGSIRWIRLDAHQSVVPGGDVLWNGVVSDVTDRRLAQDELRDREHLYRLLNELAPNAITVSDLEGRIRMANRAALQLFGEDEDAELVGRSVFEWVAPESRELAQAKLLELFTVLRFQRLELGFLRRDGDRFDGEVDVSLVRDDQGRPRMVIIVASDLTQRRRLEGERLRLQKLEAIGTLAGGLAHDFNNLLQGVFGYISLARMKLEDPAAAAAMLAQAERASGQAVSLTSQLLTFAKGGKPQKKRLSLPAVVEGATHFALSGTSTVCALDAPAGLWDADADEGQIVQVVQNIVMNASQAMQQAGVVRIELANLDLPGGSDGALPAGGRFVVVRIADAGVGIAPSYLPRIFDPYFTTKQSGSGLGLATAWSIVKRHGGSIRVASEPGRGTTFEVLLPAAAAEAGPMTSEPSAGKAAPGQRRLRVLVMDDEELIRSVAGAMIGSLGHTVDEAVDGREAVDLVERAIAAGQPYDIVVLDLTVRGGMGGDEAIGLIRALAPGIRAVVSSGYSDSAVVAEFRAHGFDAFLNKPYTLEALREVLVVPPAH
jgi:two-component system cell cycle sensor histidine kinase/response regulator CckA